MVTLLEGGEVGRAHVPLERTPVFLRVGVDPGGKVQALERLGDRPFDGEKIFVYRRVRGEGTAEVRAKSVATGKWFRKEEPVYTYVFYERQPGADVLWDTRLWQEWAAREMERVKA